RPPELGVGQYNVSNLRVQPSYGFWARHVKNLELTDCTFNYEEQDGRYALFLKNVHGAKLTGIETVTMGANDSPVAAMESVDISISDSQNYRKNWGELPQPLTVTALRDHDE